jgi:hypothetical protein
MNSDDRAILEQEDLGDLVIPGTACPACGIGVSFLSAISWSRQ